MDSWHACRIHSCTFNRGNESITTMWKGLDEARLVSVVPQSIAQSVDGFVEAAFEVDEGVVWPQSLCEFFPGHHFARALQQRHQHLKGLFLQLDLRALAAQLAGSRIHFKDA